MAARLLTDIIFFGQRCVLACDSQCNKAWGINSRPRVFFPEGSAGELDEDDYAFLADSEIDEAPLDPGTYEGGHAKPRTPEERHNKWCARECERSVIEDTRELVRLHDFSRRVCNLPQRQAEMDARTAGGR